MTVIDQIASKIIREQELIIGPLAWREAGRVSGVHVVDAKLGSVTIENGDPKMVIDKLVAQYDRLFGMASHEVSKEAAAPFLVNLPQAEVPQSLR